MRTHTKSVNTNLTPAQIEALKQVYTGNVAELLRQLLKAHVERRGGTWPDAPGHGEHLRSERK